MANFKRDETNFMWSIIPTWRGAGGRNLIKKEQSFWLPLSSSIGNNSLLIIFIIFFSFSTVFMLAFYYLFP